MNKLSQFKMFMQKLNYFDRLLNRHQSLPRRYAPDMLLYSSEADLLSEIGTHEPITATELARLKISTPSAISQIVEKLDSKGLLLKDTHDGNRKTIYLQLSEEGRKVYDAHRQMEEARYRAYLAELEGYTPEDLEKAMGLIDFLTEKYLEEFRSLDM